MNEKLRDKKALKLFLVLTIPISIIWESLYIIYQNSLFILILMWTPGIAGIITSQVYYKKKNSLGMRLGKFRYILAGLFIPIIYLTFSYVISWYILKDSTIGLDALAVTMGYQTDAGIPVMVYIMIALVVGMFSSCISALGEELGWRGFMYPVMERVIGRKKALILGGLIWAIWHMPIMVAGLYQAETQLGYGLMMFTVEVILMSIIMAWLRITSNSLIPALCVHASHNLFDQMVFQPMSTEKYVPYLAGEQGFITILLLVVIVGGVVRVWKQEKNEY